MISLLLVDGQALIRQAFAVLLALPPDLEIVGQAADGATAIGLVRDRQPDVVLMDVQLGGQQLGEDELSATAAITALSPAAEVVITTFGRPGYLRRAMAAGAVGFLIEDAPADLLLDGLRRVHQRLRVVDPTLAADSLAMGESPLTERETQVLAVAAGGRSTHAVAVAVHLSEGTVRNNLSSVMRKLGAGSRGEAVRWATDNGWLD